MAKPAAASAASAAAKPAGSANAGANGGGAACALVSPADVAAAYGEAFEAGSASSPGGQSSCLFKQSGGGIDTVNLLVVPAPQADNFYTTNKSGYDSTDVPGLGDRAFVSKDGGMIGVQRGGTTYLVHLVGFEKDNPASLQAKQKTFAQTVLSHAK